MLIEIAGATRDEVRELIGQQVKFEAKIGNQTVFRGGDDITYVCRSADCAGIVAVHFPLVTFRLIGINCQ